jgi:hypothetical protein
MAGRFSKQAAPFLQTKFNLVNDSVAGGVITAAPSGLTVSQSQQNLPGDRVIMGPADAFNYQNNNVGSLYEGTYRYVQTRNNSTSSPLINRAAFWDPTAGGLTGNNIGSPTSDAKYIVTSDGNAANYTDTLFAGVYINNNITAGYFTWIQESGKATVKLRATLTGSNNIGVGVYNLLTPVANNNNDNGAFDTLAGGNSAAVFTANSTTGYTAVDQMITNYIGVAETAPSNNNTCLVDMPGKFGYRW